MLPAVNRSSSWWTSYRAIRALVTPAASILRAHSTTRLKRISSPSQFQSGRRAAIPARKNPFPEPISTWSGAWRPPNAADQSPRNPGASPPRMTGGP